MKYLCTDILNVRFCSVDNMAVERAIRPLTVQRKNSLIIESLYYNISSIAYEKKIKKDPILHT